MPRYAQFPMRAYDRKGGIAAIEQWEAVKKRYTA